MSDTSGGRQDFDPKVFLEGGDRVTPVEEITGVPAETAPVEPATPAEPTEPVEGAPIVAAEPVQTSQTLAQALEMAMRGETEVAPVTETDPAPVTPTATDPTIAEPETPTEPTRQFPAPETPTAEQIITQRYGRVLSPEEMTAVLDFTDRVRSMPPEQQQQLEQLLYGVPVQQQTPPPVQQQPNPLAPPPGFDTLEPEVQDAVQQYIAPVQQQLTQMQQTLMQQQQVEVQRQQAALQAELNMGMHEFGTTYGLDENELAKLEQQVGQSNILAGLYQAHSRSANPNPGKAAIQSAMEQVYWADPNWRERDAARNAALAAETAARDAAEAERKRKAGAVASGGASVSRTDTPPANRQDRQSGLRDSLAKVLSGDNVAS